MMRSNSALLTDAFGSLRMRRGKSDMGGRSPMSFDPA